MSNEQTFITDVEGVCPCGGRWFAGTDPEPSVVHTKPICEEFDKLEPEDYLKWIREGLQGTRTN